MLIIRIDRIDSLIKALALKSEGTSNTQTGDTKASKKLLEKCENGVSMAWNNNAINK